MFSRVPRGFKLKRAVEEDGVFVRIHYGKTLADGSSPSDCNARSPPCEHRQCPPTLSPGQRDNAKLLHQPPHVGLSPLFHNLAISYPVNHDARLLHTPTSRRNAE